MIKKIIGWIISIFLILLFFALTPFSFSNIIMLVAGIWAMPLILNKIQEKNSKFSITGKKYHKEGCKYLKKSCISTTLSSALAQGYTACSVCNP